MPSKTGKKKWGFRGGSCGFCRRDAGRGRLVTVFFTLFACFPVGGVVKAQPVVKLQAAAGITGSQYGNAVALYRNALFVGANRDDTRAENAGAVYLYQKEAGSWQEAAILFAEDGEAEDGFGVSVATDSSFVIVGAIGDDDAGANAGAAYIFQQQGAQWVPHTKITAADGAANDGFGYAVDINGQLAVVGARGVDDRGNSSGAVYVFLYANDDWVQLGKITASDGASGDLFGSSVAINDFYVIVGAVLADGGAMGTGAVYVFQNRGAGWLQHAKLYAADGQWLDQYGHAVVLDGNTIAVGVRGADAAAEDAGAVYTFEVDAEGVVQTSQLGAADAGQQDFFGHALALSGNMLVAGAPGDDDQGAGAGAAYVFERLHDQWRYIQKLTPQDVAAGFGAALAASRAEVVAGATEAAYVFDLSSVLTKVEVESDLESAMLVVESLYPNPGAGEVEIDYVLRQTASVNARVYDLHGRLIRQLFAHEQGRGHHKFTWDGKGERGIVMPAGIYVLRIQAGTAVSTRMLVRI